MAWFYDTEDFASGSTRKIERIYCFLFDSFLEADWGKLSAIYESLPHPQPSITTPYWFGSEETGNYLYASVELPGLQVAGTLLEANWLAWEAEFHKQVQDSSLPRYEVD